MNLEASIQILLYFSLGRWRLRFFHTMRWNHALGRHVQFQGKYYYKQRLQEVHVFVRRLKAYVPDYRA